MRVVGAHRRRVLDQVRGEFWHRFGVGAAGVEAAEALSGAVVGWREWRRLRVNGAYLSAAVEVVAAQERAELVLLGAEEPPVGAR